MDQPGRSGSPEDRPVLGRRDVLRSGLSLAGLTLLAPTVILTTACKPRFTSLYGALGDPDINGMKLYLPA